MERQATGHVPVLWMPGLVLEAGRHRLKLELIDRVSVQLGGVVDPAKITVGWAMAVAVQIGGRKECIQSLCILAERKDHWEICRISLC